MEPKVTSYFMQRILPLVMKEIGPQVSKMVGPFVAEKVGIPLAKKVGLPIAKKVGIPIAKKTGKVLLNRVGYPLLTRVLEKNNITLPQPLSKYTLRPTPETAPVPGNNQDQARDAATQATEKITNNERIMNLLKRTGSLKAKIRPQGLTWPMIQNFPQNPSGPFQPNLPLSQTQIPPQPVSQPVSQSISQPAPQVAAPQPGQNAFNNFFGHSSTLFNRRRQQPWNR